MVCETVWRSTEQQHPRSGLPESEGRRIVGQYGRQGEGEKETDDEREEARWRLAGQEVIYLVDLDEGKNNMSVVPSSRWIDGRLINVVVHRWINA